MTQAGISPNVTCLECGTFLGGHTGKDPYKHMLGCLNVEPDSLARIKDAAEAERNEHGRRVLHIVSALLSSEE